MDSCVFCKIVSGDIPSFKVSENDDFLAFLSIAPIKSGHTLVIPKKHSEYLFDMEDDELGELVKFSKPVANKMEVSLHPKSGKVALWVAGLEVPHTHIHLIPMDSEEDLDFKKAKSASSEELKMVLDKMSS